MSVEIALFCLAAFAAAFVAGLAGFAFGLVAMAIWLHLLTPAQTAMLIMLIAVGGWMVITMTSSGVVGLAVVTAAGLVVAGAIISVAFWLKMRRRVPSSP